MWMILQPCSLLTLKVIYFVGSLQSENAMTLQWASQVFPEGKPGSFRYTMTSH